MTDTLRVESLVKVYRKKRVVDDVSCPSAEEKLLGRLAPTERGRPPLFIW